MRCCFWIRSACCVGWNLTCCFFVVRSSEADAEAVALGEQRSTDLSRILSELYLRRTKDVELADDLPKKVERIVFCEPSELQKELYKHVIAQPDFMLLSLANAPCDCGVNQKVGRFFLVIRNRPVPARLTVRVLSSSFLLNFSSNEQRKSALRTNAKIDRS